MFILGQQEIALLFLFCLCSDVPRYFFTMMTLYVFRVRTPPRVDMQISAVVPCLNEEEGLRACVESLNVDEVIVVDDGSTDKTWDVITKLMAEGKVHHAVHLNRRGGKANAINVGLRFATKEAVMILDSDTRLLVPDAAQLASHYLADEPRCGAVNMNLIVRNAFVSLTTRLQALEYLSSISFGKQMPDILGTLSNVSGAAGLFRRSALTEVGGMDIEIAEDAAITGKLRDAGWTIRFATNAIAETRVPETMLALLTQRLRWDSTIVSNWLRKFANNLNPFKRKLSPVNLISALDVVLFSVVLPIAFPVYLVWLWTTIGMGASLMVLAYVAAILAVMETLSILMTRPDPRLLLYIPYYLIIQLFVMRPARVLFIVCEMVTMLSRRDNFVPAYQREHLS